MYVSVVAYGMSYSGTSTVRTPLGPHTPVLNREVSSLQRWRKHGSRPYNGGVLNSEGCNREVPLYMCVTCCVCERDQEWIVVIYSWCGVCTLRASVCSPALMSVIGSQYLVTGCARGHLKAEALELRAPLSCATLDQCLLELDSTTSNLTSIQSVNLPYIHMCT